MTCALVLAFGATSASASSFSTSPLVGSTFHAADGDQDATSPETDWQTYQNDITATSGSKIDSPYPATTGPDYFYQGHENKPAEWIQVPVDGGITPPKSNALAAMGIKDPGVTSKIFFYFSFIRKSTSNADAFYGFELNSRTNMWWNGNYNDVAHTDKTMIPCRSDHDLMVSYEIAPNTKNVNVKFYEWRSDPTKPGPTACPEGAYGDFYPAPGSTNGTIFGAAQGYMNFDDPITNYLRTDLFTSPLSAGVFGEGAVDVDAVIGQNTTNPCFNFGQVQLHSRSAASLDSALQDVVDPLPVDVANCEINVDKKVRVHNDGAGGQGSYVDSPNANSNLVSATVGQTLDYEFTVTNTGTKDLQVTFSDNRCDTQPTAPDSGDPDADSLLQPTETWVYHCTHLLTAADLPNLESDGTFKNTVTVTGTVPNCTPEDATHPLVGCGDDDTDSTNVKILGKLKVIKHLVSASGGTDGGLFKLFIKDSTPTTLASVDNVGEGGTTNKVVAPGTYSVSEAIGSNGTTALADYTSSISCTKPDGNGTTSVASSSDSGPLSVTVAAGDDTTCTITNTRNQGTVKVVKVVNAATGETTDPGKFNLKIDGTTKATDVAYPGGDTGTPTPVSPYVNHGVSEAAGTGTTLGDYTSTTSCIKNGDTQNPLSSTTAFSVGSQDAVVCTITN
ncbi:MAG: hypothetical protein ACJ76Z_06530, partial [Thermoleophilaceae bacterium]